MRRLAILAVLTLHAASAHAADGAAPAGVDVALELVRSLGLPSAFLLLVWWDQRRERARTEATRAALLADHARDRTAWEAELRRVNEARLAAATEMHAAMVEAISENSQAVKAHTEALRAGDYCPVRAEKRR